MRRGILRAGMDGDIIYFDAVRGTGFIAGSDGNRYVFDRSDLSVPTVPQKGVRTTFRPDGDRARAIVLEDAGLSVQAASPGDATGHAPRVLREHHGSVPSIGGGDLEPIEPVPSPPPAPQHQERARRGVLGHFFAALFSGYADFRGRARRKEFWSFTLVAVAILLAAAIGGVFADFTTGNLYEIATDKDFAFDGEPWLTALVLGGAILLLLMPLLAVTVRRIHDIGLPGWFVLLGFIPSVGNLVMLGFALWPGDRGANRWGPAP